MKYLPILLFFAACLPAISGQGIDQNFRIYPSDKFETWLVRGLEVLDSVQVSQHTIVEKIGDMARIFKDIEMQDVMYIFTLDQSTRSEMVPGFVGWLYSSSGGGIYVNTAQQWLIWFYPFRDGTKRVFFLGNVPDAYKPTRINY